MRTFVGGKIHGIRITSKSLHYNGSVTVDRKLLEMAGMQVYEQVQVVNVSNGQRWITYLFPGEDGEFALNGAAARLGEVGDKCILMTFQIGDSMEPAKVVFCDEHNHAVRTMIYQPEQ